MTNQHLLINNSYLSKVLAVLAITSSVKQETIFSRYKSYMEVCVLLKIISFQS